MFKFSDRIKDLNGAATREILKLTAKPEVISFAGGMPAADCLPCDIINEIASDILSSADAKRVLQYGTTEGDPILIEQLVKYMNALGIRAAANGLQVLSGGQQGLDLMCKAFINNGDTILVENPTYLAFLQIAKTYQANVIGVKSDDDGLVLSDLENKLKAYKPKLLYIVPTFSNPTGRTYSAQNRKAIVELCEKYGTVVIEDDPYGRLRYSGDAVPLVKSFDRSGNVVYVTSFSKTIAPGLRVAFICGDPELIRKVSIGKQGVDVQNVGLTQRIVAEYLKRGYLDKVVNANIKVYAARRDTMLSALDRYMPKEVKYTRPSGGLFIWAELPEYLDATKLLGEALEQNVAYINGSEFFVEENGKAVGKNTLRLNFSNSDEARIEKGIKILSKIIKGHIR